MTTAAHVNDQMRMLAWYGLVIVIAYYCLASLALRLRFNRGVRIVRYEPPDKVSPATACFLWERGATEKPLAVALVSMAAKGFLRIERGQSDYLVSKADAFVLLEPEEQSVAEILFHPRLTSVLLSEVPGPRMQYLARSIRSQLESAVEPDLISSHYWWFIPGLTLSLWSVAAALYPEFVEDWGSPHGPLMILPALVGIVTAWMMLNTLPALLYKLKSHLPGRAPQALPFERKDATVFYLAVLAVGCFAGFADLTSAPLAEQLGLFVLVNMIGALALRTPTDAGRAVLDQLADFREFLAAVDSDPINRVNSPSTPSPAAEKYWGWALALDVEHSWGEQFGAALLNCVGPLAAAASMEDNIPENRRAGLEMVDLHLK